MSKETQEIREGIMQRLCQNHMSRLDLQRQIRELQEQCKLLDEQAADIWDDMDVIMHADWVLDSMSSKIRIDWTAANPGWKATRSGIQRIKK